MKCSLTKKKKMSFSVPVAHRFTRGVINHQDCYRRYSNCCNAGVLFVCIKEKGKKHPDYYLAPKIGFPELYKILPGLGCSGLTRLTVPRQRHRGRLASPDLTVGKATQGQCCGARGAPTPRHPCPHAGTQQQHSCGKDPC